jgi:hypothetical protein
MNRLSDQQLLGKLQSLRERERATTLTILLHLHEVDRPLS